MYLSKHLIHLWITMRSVCILKTENMQKSTYYCVFLTLVKLGKNYKLLSCNQVRKLNIKHLNVAKDYSLDKWLQLTRAVPTYTMAWVFPPKNLFVLSSLINLHYCFGMQESAAGLYLINMWPSVLSHSVHSLPRHTREGPHGNYTWSFLNNFKQFVLFVD